MLLAGHQQLVHMHQHQKDDGATIILLVTLIITIILSEFVPATNMSTHPSSLEVATHRFPGHCQFQNPKFKTCLTLFHPFTSNLI